MLGVTSFNIRPNIIAHFLSPTFELDPKSRAPNESEVFLCKPK
jgi:hypothetical protein